MDTTVADTAPATSTTPTVVKPRKVKRGHGGPPATTSPNQKMLPAFTEDVYLGTTVHSNVEWMDGFDESTVSSEGTWVDLTEYYFSRGHHVIVAKPFRTATSKRAQRPDIFYKPISDYVCHLEYTKAYIMEKEPDAFGFLADENNEDPLSLFGETFRYMVKDDLLKIRGRLIKQDDKVCHSRLFLVSRLMYEKCFSGGFGNRIPAAFSGFSPTPC